VLINDYNTMLSVALVFMVSVKLHV